MALEKAGYTVACHLAEKPYFISALPAPDSP